MTTNFIAEVLSSTGNVERENLHDKMRKLERRAEELKIEMYEGIHRKHSDFYPLLDAANNLAERVEKLKMDVDDVSVNMEKEIKDSLHLSKHEFEDLGSQLSETCCILTILDKLVAVSSCDENFEKALTEGHYDVAAIKIQEMKEVLEKPVNEREGEVAILQVLTDTLLANQRMIRTKLLDKLSAYICWETNSDTVRVCKIISSSDPANEKKLECVFQALVNLNTANEEIEALARKVLSKFLMPAMTVKGVTVDTQTEDGFDVLKLTMPEGDTKTPAPITVCKTLRPIFQYFQTTLLKVAVTKYDDDHEEHVTLMELFGDVIAEEFTKNLIDGCLNQSVPSNKEELSKYDVVAKATASLQSELRKSGFLSDDDNTLTDYVSNVNELFANKKSSEMLAKVRDLLTSDIHNTLEVNDLPLFPDSSDAEQEEEKFTQSIGKTSEEALPHKLSPNTMKFPKCRISTWTDEFVKLLYFTLQEACAATPDLCLQLFYSVRNSLEMFSAVVPLYHRDSIEKLPQSAAVYHNNCMYVAHHLLTLGAQFSKDLRPLLQNAECITFTDFVPMFRRMGTNALFNQIRIQREQLLDLLKDAEDFQQASDPARYGLMDRGVRQCLLHVKKVGSSWAAVLPNFVCLNAIGTLLNAVAEHVITAVTSLEDISADDAVNLHMILGQLVRLGPEVFKCVEVSGTPVVVLASRHIRKFRRLQELQQLMTSELLQIADRWADGHGPLAAEFSAGTVKHLIRALFQNSDRRAAVINRIK